MSVSQVSAANSSMPEIVDEGANSKVDKTTFLTLLTTQLKYQDPSNPVDSNQMTEQQVMFAELEQIMNLNESMSSFMQQQNEMMSGITSVFNTMESTGFIGKDVKYFSDEVTVGENGCENELYFDLSQDALIGYTVRNESGVVVQKVDKTAMTEEQQKAVGWDGKDSQGEMVPPGKYTIEINAQDSTGKELKGKTYTEKLVDSVSFGSDMPVLVLSDGSKISAASILSVGAAGE